MLEYQLSDKILFVGPDCSRPKGGVAQVLHSYKGIIQPFHFLSSTCMEGGTWKKISFFARCLTKFVILMPSKRIKIVHLHGASNGSFWRAALLILIAKAFGKRVVYHMHGGGFKVFAAKHLRAVRFVMRRADVLVALSNSWKVYFEQELGVKNVTVIPNIIEEPVLSSTVRKENDSVCRFLFLGLICKNKGVYDLLDVIRDHKEAWRGKAQFIFGGNGEVEKFLNQVKEYGIEDMVEYAGWVSGGKKVAYLNRAHVYVLPSYFEGLPISILEAMSYGLPVIATNVGGIPEIVETGKNGYLITAGDKEALGNAIGKCMDNRQLMLKWGGYSRSLVEEHLPEAVEGQLRRLYHLLL